MLRAGWSVFPPGWDLMRNRRSLERRVSVDGVGLHSGRQVHLALLPAPPETGIVFVRTDLAGLRIPATLEHVGPSFFATVIRHGEESISTIEHLMAALYALQIDDLIVELDAPEVPILDGSSRPFVELVRRGGPVESDVLRQYITLIRPIALSQDDKRIAAYPCREYRVTYAIDFDHPLLGYQELSASLWRESDFAEKLAPARTFTFESEVEALRRKGLALGGSLDNAVVLGEKGILNGELRFADEFVRHKMLDLTGDLSLLGRPLRAHIVAYRAGHDLHGRLAQRIAEASNSWYLAPWSDESPAQHVVAEA